MAHPPPGPLPSPDQALGPWAPPEEEAKEWPAPELSPSLMADFDGQLSWKPAESCYHGFHGFAVS